MSNYKKMLLATAAIALVGAGAPSKAFAFDTVNWNWTQTIDTAAADNITINVDNTPTGIVNLEKTQTQIGDVTANSTMTDITNNPPSAAGGTATVSIPLDLTASYNDNAEGNPITGVVINTPGWSDGNASGNVDNNNELINMTFDLNGTVTVPPVTPIDAVDLPSVDSNATAVGNNQSISSSTALNLHDGQFLYGGYDPTMDGALQQIDTSGVSGNVNTNAAAFLTFASSIGAITPATVTADSEVSQILNASVNSAATAVGNNMDVTLTAFTPPDAVIQGDVTQYSYANVNAISNVQNVTIDNYSNLAALNGPLVNSNATAVGNNFSVTVTSPTPTVATGL